MTDSNRLIWIDALRLMAGLSMLGLHATADPNGQPWPDYDASERVTPILLRAILYTARTELFIIISIFLLMMALDKRPRGYATTIQQQSRRLLVPFLFWTVFYAGYGLIKAVHFGYLEAALAQLRDPVEWLGFLLLGDVKYHMHFIPTLFGILVFFPLFQKAVERPILGLTVLFCLMVKAQLDAVVYPALWGTDWLVYALRTVKILTYVGYGMAAGALYSLYRDANSERFEKWLAPLVILGLVLGGLKLVASYRTIQTGTYPFDYAPGYWADFLMPICLFLGCMILANRAWPLKLSTWAPYSFGIYLCHPIFLDLAEMAIRDWTVAPIHQIAFKIAFVLAGTVCFVVWLKRLSPLAWTIGLGPLPAWDAIRSKPAEGL